MSLRDPSVDRARAIQRPISSRSPSPAPSSYTPRSFSTARLASAPGESGLRPIPTGNSHSSRTSRDETPLAGGSINGSLNGPRTSSLSQALYESLGKSPPRFGTPATRVQESNNDSAEASTLARSSLAVQDTSGATPRGRTTSTHTTTNEDIDTVRRHLIGPSHRSSNNNLQPSAAASIRRNPNVPGPDDDDAGFSSLQLQGGDTTRHIYRYTEDQERRLQQDDERKAGKMKRSVSMFLPPTEDDDHEIVNIKKPGGLRREYISRTAESPAPSDRISSNAANGKSNRPDTLHRRPAFLANNFIEFLTLYGHFAGEELEEDDELLEPNEYFASEDYDDDSAGEQDPNEESALLTPARRKRKRKGRAAGKGSPGGAAMLLLKSFVGTGVLFLPRAFLNGGMAFSNVVLLIVSALSFWCFILLVNTRLMIHASFGDMGGQIYGKHFRNLINFSLVLSQVGFASAYIVFVAQNLQAFILAVTKCGTFIDIKYLIILQMIIFLPLSLYRNINNIQKLALVADLFIALGLIYLYYYDIWTISNNHGVSDIVQFNANDWTLFMGTAIFTFEGIGLIIPIQSGMKEPSKFPRVLAIVMVAVCIVYLSIGTLSYAAYGSSTKTVILLNLPQDDKMVNTVQLIYSLAILMSTPLQIYPAIEITSQQLFSRTGKYNPWIKWKKNIFRFAMVMFCSLIAWIGAGDLDKFVALVGSFACVPLVYIYPVSHSLLLWDSSHQSQASSQLCHLQLLLNREIEQKLMIKATDALPRHKSLHIPARRRSVSRSLWPRHHGLYDLVDNL